MPSINCGTFYGNGAASGRFRAEIVLQADDTGSGYKIYRIARIYVIKATSQFTSNMRVSWSSEVTTPIKCGTTGNYYGVSPAKLIGTYAYGQTVTISEECHYYPTGGGTYQSDVTAKYTIPYPKYTITYNANGGTGAPAAQTKTYGQNLVLSSTKPTRTSYLFQGWNTNKAATTAQYNSGATYTANAAATLYAVWKIGSYTIHYDANGGVGAPADQKKEHDKSIVLSTTRPTRTNYEFVGWGTTKTASNYQPGATYSTNANLTLYAIWRQTTFEITYNGNGASSGAVENTPKPENVAVTIARNAFTKTGYVFSSWNTAADGSGTTYAEGAQYTANANLNLYAQWIYRGAAITVNAYRTLTNLSKKKHPGGQYVYVIIKYIYALKPALSPRTLTYGSTSISLGTSEAQEGQYEMWLDDQLDPEQKYTFQFRMKDVATNTDSNVVTVVIPADNDYFFRFFGLEKYLKMKRPLETDRIILPGGNGVGHIYSRTIEGEDIEVFSAINSSNHTSVGYGHYEKELGNTSIYGADVGIGVKHGGVGTWFRPYYKPGEVEPYGYLAVDGWVTSNGTEIHFTIPLSKPMINVTSVSVAGNMILRQNGVYPNNSSGGVKPDHYTAYMCKGGVRVIATFNSPSNIINNDTIGIYINPTITFG